MPVSLSLSLSLCVCIHITYKYRSISIYIYAHIGALSLGPKEGSDCQMRRSDCGWKRVRKKTENKEEGSQKSPKNNNKKHKRGVRRESEKNKNTKTKGQKRVRKNKKRVRRGPSSLRADLCPRCARLLQGFGGGPPWGTPVSPRNVLQGLLERGYRYRYRYRCRYRYRLGGSGDLVSWLSSRPCGVSYLVLSLLRIRTGCTKSTEHPGSLHKDGLLGIKRPFIYPYLCPNVELQGLIAHPRKDPSAKTETPNNAMFAYLGP